MGETRRPSGLRRALFDRPILKLFLVLLFIAIAFTLVQLLSIRVLTLLIGPLIIIAVAYAVILAGHIVNVYLIRRAFARLLTAKDIASLLLSYVMFIVVILLVISTLSPVHLREVPWVRTAVAVYGTGPVSFAAGFAVLAGDFPAEGRMPVEFSP